MCLIGIAWQCHPRYSLVMAANRDELHARPSRPAHWWADHGDVLGGIDRMANGAWCAVSRTGRLALVANQPGRPEPAEPKRSRGDLVRDWVTAATDPGDFCHDLAGTHAHFGGFSLIAGTLDALWLLRSPTEQGLHRERLRPGVLAISNADGTARWPKVAYLEDALGQLLTRETIAAADLLAILAARAPVRAGEPPVARLPRVASTPFIADSTYGTRSSTVLLITRTGHATFVERSFDHHGDRQGDVTVEFAIGQA